MTPTYKRWADAAGSMYGGLDICTVDAIHAKDTGEETILEVNGTSSGFLPECKAEDNGHIRELVLSRMESCLFAP